MKILRLVTLLAALAFAAPATAVQEDTILTAVAATADQVGTTITRPPTAEGFIAILDVTAGATLLLDIEMEFYSPAKDAWYGFSVECPASGFLTAVGVYSCPIYPLGDISGYALAGSSAIPKFVMVPSEFRLRVNHGNANAATYQLFLQWIPHKK